MRTWGGGLRIASLPQSLSIPPPLYKINVKWLNIYYLFVDTLPTLYIHIILLSSLFIGVFVDLSQVKVVDLFCGAGGLSYGLKSAHLPISAGVDIDKTL